MAKIEGNITFKKKFCRLFLIKVLSMNSIIFHTILRIEKLISLYTNLLYKLQK